MKKKTVIALFAVFLTIAVVGITVAFMFRKPPLIICSSRRRFPAQYTKSWTGGVYLRYPPRL